MQKSDGDYKASVSHRKVKASTTLNRKYVSRPNKSSDISVSVRRSSKVRHFSDVMPAKKIKKDDGQPMVPPVVHPVQAKAISRMQDRASKPAVSKMTAKELKDQAIKKALADAEKISSDQTSKKQKKSIKMHFSFGKVLLALSCAAAAVFAIVYFVNLNMPDISIKVAAMRTGIEASYPSYVPKDFSLSDIASEDGKVTLNFKNTENGDLFSLTEEKSSWDSNALLNNFVKSEYGEDYTIVREQGLTIYVNGSSAAWANGGVVYKIYTVSGSLTKKQIKSIATSL